MAKHGTNRGGARVGAGRKKKPLAEKIQEGKAAKAVVLPEPPELTAAELPDVKEYLSDTQRTGQLYGKEIYLEVWKWLYERNCAQLVSPQLLEQYSRARQHDLLHVLVLQSHHRHGDGQIRAAGKDHLGVRIYLEASHNRRHDRQPLCNDGTELSQTGESPVAADLRGGGSKLHGACDRRSSG